MSELPMIHICTRCLTPAGEGGTCSACGGQRISCRPGDPDDPCRRPLMDDRGRVLTRAPLWWLQHTVPQLIELMK